MLVKEIIQKRREFSLSIEGLMSMANLMFLINGIYFYKCKQCLSCLYLFLLNIICWEEKEFLNY
jgi:hypothetical protein